MTIDTSRPAATIEEVATAAGVSRSTVSRVVNGSTSVSRAALDAVTRAIADLNYVPNKAEARHVDVGMCSAFGFGGQNASMVIRRFVE